MEDYFDECEEEDRHDIKVTSDPHAAPEPNREPEAQEAQDRHDGGEHEKDLDEGGFNCGVLGRVLAYGRGLGRA